MTSWCSHLDGWGSLMTSTTYDWPFLVGQELGAKGTGSKRRSQHFTTTNLRNHEREKVDNVLEQAGFPSHASLPLSASTALAWCHIVTSNCYVGDRNHLVGKRKCKHATHLKCSLFRCLYYSLSEWSRGRTCKRIADTMHT